MKTAMEGQFNVSYADSLKPGDAIGIISPSHGANKGDYAQIARTIEGLGFRVKLGRNIFKRTYGYLASEQERADDLNSMVTDGDVRMILFGGGWGASEILPLIDYENIACHPKRFSSYSDGTSILGAVYAKTGLVTYYGLGAGAFECLTDYDRAQFLTHFVEGKRTAALTGNGGWRILRPGVCEGTLTGGYTINFALLLAGAYSPAFTQHSGKHILFLEDHERFNDVGGVSVYLSHIEQHPFIESVTGLVFGHYADNVPAELLQRLERFGEKHRIPVVYCDDFGHYTRHSVLPIGVRAALDTATQTLAFKEG